MLNKRNLGRAGKALLPYGLVKGWEYWKDYRAAKPERDAFNKYRHLVERNKKFKNIHKGERCFILASGPSIKEQDLKPLKNEIVFALNNFYVHEDYDIIMGGDKPKYYVVAPIHPPQPDEVWRQWLSNIVNSTEKGRCTYFMGLDRYERNIYELGVEELNENEDVSWYYRDRRKTIEDFTVNITESLAAASTVSVYGLLLSLYMGFDEVYLLGLDHDHINKKNNVLRFYKNSFHHNYEINNLSNNEVNFYKNIFILWKYYNYINNYALKNNNMIYNCSLGSELGVFEKVKYSDIIVNQ